MRLLLSISCLLLCTAGGWADSEPASESLEVEHRGAKGGDSFLDQIASLITGEKPPSDRILQSPPLAALGPVYRPLKPPPRQQLQAGSQQRPVVLPPPPNGFNKKPVYPKIPPRIGAAESNLSPVSQPAPYGSGLAGGADPWQIAQPASMAQIKDLQVQCEKDLMRVRIIFDRPFYGMVFSKGHYSNINCVHVPAGLGQTQATFDIAMGQCGMSTGGNSDGYTGAPSPQGSFIENTIIVQYDPLLQEVWDQARKMRCTWYDFYEKAVTFKPYQVDMLDPVTANFLGDNLRCWMQIQVGKGPYASEVSGIVKIGQTMTMVLGVKDDENKFDMMVRNCVAHDGSRAPIQLVDEKGCVVREKIMSPFKKLKNFDATANVLSYAYFQAFKFPDSMNVHFQCVVQVCRGSCPEPLCGGQPLPASINNGDSYGGPLAPALDSYGSPNVPALDSYGSPVGQPLNTYGSPGAFDSYSSPGGFSNRVDPRVPNNKIQYAGSERRITLVEPSGVIKQNPIPLKADSTFATAFSKRTGDGNPRSLDFKEGEDVKDGVEKKAEVEDEGAVSGNAVDEAALNRRRRSAPQVDANGNRVLKVVRREAVEAEGEAVDQADIQTERVIRVVAPSDVQFQLNEDGKEEVVINTNSVPAESLCVDTSAFVGATITLLMLLIIAGITIVFLGLRVRAIGRKSRL